MPTQKTVTAYLFDELSEQAKDKAREWFREHALDHEWWVSAYQDAETIAALMGIEIDRGRSATTPDIEFSGFASQGDGACFTGTWIPKEGSDTAVRDHTPTDEKLHAIADELEGLGAALGPNVRAVITKIDNHYCHDGTVRADLETIDGEDAPWTEADRKAVTEALRAFMQWIYRQLEAEYTYRMSDEVIDEDIRANEYLFTEQGSRSVVL